VELLLGHLAAQREHVLGILDGLTDEQLRRPLLPSGWHCLGLVSHLTVGVERYWFHCVVAGAPLGALPRGPAADWRVAPGEAAAAVLGRYRDAIRTSDTVLAAAAADAAPAQPDPVWREWGSGFPDVRSVWRTW
jgi:hypothetical protein